MADVVKVFETQVGYLERRISELEVSKPEGDLIRIYKTLLAAAKRQSES